MRTGHRSLVEPDLDGRVSRYLPTFGNPGFSLDLITGRQITTSGFNGVNACFSDVYAFQALSRLIEGPIRSMHDFQAAEAALQALVFYDHTALLNPALVKFKGDKPGMIFRPYYGGQYEPFRLPVGHQTMSDEVVVFDHVEVADNRIIGAAGEASELLGKALPDDLQAMFKAFPKLGALLASYPAEFSLPAFFAQPSVQMQFTSSSDFASTLYETVSSSYVERRSAIPGSTVEVRLPLLTWHLLGTVNQRSDIPGAVLELRDQLSEARNELAELDARMRSMTRENDRIKVARHYTEAFESVVISLGQSNFAHVRHVIYQLIDFASLSLTGRVMKLFNPNWTASSPVTIARRSIAAKAFRELLLDLESIEHLLSTGLFSPEERASLRAAAPN